ncbi:hypothetical protein OUZ56_017738 [Daphnia magna]|uniref:Alpha-1,3-glucosyltransferase n=1 Tax=Daphnia magna TaxID=35525 RepID=A0ABR0ATK3_9CRUS|nr:hypothetical protein OUZ56_017729 [Daphnia magna]KAK4028462.1 hypothetical protein OUZ56_017738 [Daphnia magna]
MTQPGFFTLKMLTHLGSLSNMTRVQVDPVLPYPSHQGKNVLAAIAFSAALNFKQMELYHAILLFAGFYLLASCQPKGSSLPSQLKNLVQIGAATVATFAIIWYPFLQIHDWQSPRPCPCLKEKVRTLIRTDSNATSTKYGHIIGGMTVCLVRDLESQVIAAS